jgi:hypothetical protein
MFYFTVNSDMPTVTVGPKLFHQQHASSIGKLSILNKSGHVDKNEQRHANFCQWYDSAMPIVAKM